MLSFYQDQIRSAPRQPDAEKREEIKQLKEIADAISGDVSFFNELLTLPVPDREPVIVEPTTGLTRKGGDAYFYRLTKLIPAETVALFLFIQGILRSALGSEGQETQLQGWMWVNFVVIVFLNVFYLKKFQFVSDRIQLAILTLAFIVWIFSLGGPFEFFSFYQPFMGSVILALFTFTVPLVYEGIDIS